MVEPGKLPSRNPCLDDLLTDEFLANLICQKALLQVIRARPHGLVIQCPISLETPAGIFNITVVSS